MFNWDPPPTPAKPTKQEKVALEKSLRLHTHGGPAAAVEAV